MSPVSIETQSSTPFLGIKYPEQHLTRTETPRQRERCTLRVGSRRGREREGRMFHGSVPLKISCSPFPVKFHGNSEEQQLQSEHPLPRYKTARNLRPLCQALQADEDGPDSFLVGRGWERNECLQGGNHNKVLNLATGVDGCLSSSPLLSLVLLFLLSNSR